MGKANYNQFIINAVEYGIIIKDEYQLKSVLYS